LQNGLFINEVYVLDCQENVPKIMITGLSVLDEKNGVKGAGD
jgi:hypothetical protein